jgi:Bacterial cellulose synthase subunit
MKKLIISLLFACNLLALCSVNAQQRVLFREEGYDNTPVYGLKGNTSFYFRLPRNGKTKEAVINIFIQASQVLNPDLSYINFTVNDQPLSADKLIADTGHYVLSVPASVLQGSDYLKLDISSDVHITDNRCQDIDNPGLWVKVLGSSYIDYKLTASGQYQNNIAQSWYLPSAVVYPDQPTAAEVSAAAWAEALLQNEKKSRVKMYTPSTLPDSVKSYIEIATADQLERNDTSLNFPSVPVGEGLVYLTNSDHDTSSSSNGRNIQLYITGANDSALLKASQALLSPAIRNSAFTSYLVVDKSTMPIEEAVHAQDMITFRQLGGVPETLSGIGSLKRNYTFSINDFNEFPDEVEIDIRAKYSGLSPNDNTERGYFNIYINGVLLGDQKLNETGRLIYTTTIHRFQLQKFNTLTTEFIFYPSHEACLNPMLNYFASVDVDNSALILEKSYQPKDLSFYHFPQVFNQHQFDVVVSRKLLPEVPEALGNLLTQINQDFNHLPVYPLVQLSDNYQAAKGYGIIAFLTREDSMYIKLKNIPVKVERDFSIFSSNHDQLLFSIQDTAQSGIAQIFYNSGNQPVLLLTAKGKHPEKELNDVAGVINNQLTDLSSNVAIATNNEHLIFNIEPGSGQLTYIGPPTALQSFWNAYRVYILLLILVMVIVMFLFIRKNVKTSRDSFNDV